MCRIFVCDDYVEKISRVGWSQIALLAQVLVFVYREKQPGEISSFTTVNF
jgi:hypothetical protein